jgi:hypothetical protein
MFSDRRGNFIFGAISVTCKEMGSAKGLTSVEPVLGRHPSPWFLVGSNVSHFYSISVDLLLVLF